MERQLRPIVLVGMQRCELLLMQRAKGVLEPQVTLDPVERDPGLDQAIQHPRERVEGSNEDVEKSHACEDNSSGELVSQQGVCGKRADGDDDGGCCPQKHADCVKVLAPPQRLEFPLPNGVDLSLKEPLPRIHAHDPDGSHDLARELHAAVLVAHQVLAQGLNALGDKPVERDHDDGKE